MTRDDHNPESWKSANLYRLGLSLFAIGFAGIGILAILYADFALQWQPVPEGVPFRSQLAMLNGIALIVGTAALFNCKSRKVASTILLVMLMGWVFLLHAPRLLGHWGDIVIWLGVAEAAAMMGGAMMLLFYVSDGDQHPIIRSLNDAGRLAIGLALPIFGLSHFAYAEFTAGMVPAWIPAKLFWAYFTGCAHVAAGVAVLTGLWAPLASRLLALMFGSWVLILHAPRVIADPANRVEWTMLFIAIGLTASACLLAARWKSERLFRPRLAESDALPQELSKLTG